MPKAGLATGTQITNVATVVFDGQNSIATDQVSDEDPSQGIDTSKQALVTIDSGAPTSSVAALPATETSGSFTVSWTGTDDVGGSGIASYSVYDSEDNGPYTPFETDTTLTSATFAGTVGHSYRFYSVATDNVGNMQTTLGTAQASTTVTSNTSNSATMFVISALPTSLTADQTTSITITAEDQSNDIITGFSDSVTLSDSLGEASFSANPVISFTNGVATVTATLDKAGTQTITASD